MAAARLDARNVWVEYYIARKRERFVALQDVSLQVNDGEFVSGAERLWKDDDAKRD